MNSHNDTIIQSSISAEYLHEQEGNEKEDQTNVPESQQPDTAKDIITEGHNVETGINNVSTPQTIFSEAPSISQETPETLACINKDIKKHFECETCSRLEFLNMPKCISIFSYCTLRTFFQISQWYEQTN